MLFTQSFNIIRVSKKKKKKKKWGESLKSSKTLKRITVGYSGDAYSFHCRMHAIVIMG